MSKYKTKLTTTDFNDILKSAGLSANSKKQKLQSKTRSRTRTSVKIQQPPGGASSVILGSCSPTAFKISKDIDLTVPKLVFPTSANKKTKPSTDASTESVNRTQVPQTQPTSKTTPEKTPPPVGKVPFEDALSAALKSERRVEQSTLFGLFTQDTTCVKEETKSEVGFQQPMELLIEFGLVSPILDQCTLIDSAALRMFTVCCQYQTKLELMKDFLLFGQGDVFHGFLKNIGKCKNDVLVKRLWKKQVNAYNPTFEPLVSKVNFTYCWNDELLPMYSPEWPLNGIISLNTIQGNCLLSKDFSLKDVNSVEEGPYVFATYQEACAVV